MRNGNQSDVNLKDKLKCKWHSKCILNYVIMTSSCQKMILSRHKLTVMNILSVQTLLFILV